MEIEKRALRRLGSNIAKLRKDRQLKQQDLAEAVGCDPSTISKLERGAMQPTLHWLLRVSRALEITVAELTTGIDR